MPFTEEIKYLCIFIIGKILGIKILLTVGHAKNNKP